MFILFLNHNKGKYSSLLYRKKIEIKYQQQRHKMFKLIRKSSSLVLNQRAPSVSITKKFQTSQIRENDVTNLIVFLFKLFLNISQMKFCL
jgi:hypothetical protein